MDVIKNQENIINAIKSIEKTCGRYTYKASKARNNFDRQTR